MRLLTVAFNGEYIRHDIDGGDQSSVDFLLRIAGSLIIKIS